MDPKIWLDSYPPGVPATIALRADASLKHLFEASVKQYATRPAISNLGTTLDYAALDRLSRSFAAYLQKACSLAPGDRVAMMMPNLLQYPVALFGALRAGLVGGQHQSALHRRASCEHQLQRLRRARDRRAGELRAHAAGGVAAHRRAHVITTQVGDLLRRSRSALLTNLVVKHVKQHGAALAHLPDAVGFARRAGARRAARDSTDVAVEPDDLAFLQYTGGTTGVAEGRDADARQHGGEPAAGRGLDRARRSSRARRP